jgi:hypothetical protein
MRRSIGVACVALALAGVAGAEGLDAAEKAWTRKCVESLLAKSDRLRASAEVALTRMGPDALVVVLGGLDRFRTDDDWEALTRVVAGMGLDGPNKLLELRGTWPRASEGRLALVEKEARRRAETAPPAPPPGGAPSPLLPKSPPQVEAEVRKALDEYRTVSRMSSGDAAIRRITALGHAAFGAVVAVLRESKGHEGMLQSAIVAVLKQIGEAGDEPVVAELMREGHLAAAAALLRVQTPAALDVLVDEVERGFVDHTILESLEPRRREPRVPKALIGWLQAHGRKGSFDTGQVAEFLGEARAAEAVPVLLPLLDVSLPSDGRMRVAKALCDLGEKAGIPALIGVLAGEGEDMHGDWPRHTAGEALNRIAGKRYYSGSFQPGSSTGNYDEAAQAFRGWWEAVQDTIRWDPARRAWMQPGG